MIYQVDAPAFKPLTGSQLVARDNANKKATEDTWLRWLDMGRSIAAHRSAAAAAAGGARRGPIYSRKLQARLTVFYETFKRYGKNGTLNSLDECLGRLAMIEAFRRSRPEDQRPCHPVAVWAAFKASTFSGTEYRRAVDPAEQQERREKKLAAARNAISRDNEVALLKEQLDERTPTRAPKTNAIRWIRAFIEEFGTRHETADLIVASARSAIEQAEVMLGGTLPMVALTRTEVDSQDDS